MTLLLYAPGYKDRFSFGEPWKFWKIMKLSIDILSSGGSKAGQFSAIVLPNNRLAFPLVLTPPLGNPGSVTAEILTSLAPRLVTFMCTCSCCCASSFSWSVAAEARRVCSNLPEFCNYTVKLLVDYSHSHQLLHSLLEQDETSHEFCLWVEAFAN